METTTKKKRPKLVYKNISEIAHLWAHQSQSEARCSNAYYEETIIYSYGKHFPIARIDTDKRGNKIVLFTLDTYSSTTAQHIRDVASACSHMEKLYMVDVPRWGDPRHDVNIKYWTNKIQQHVSKIPKARDNKEYLVREAGSYIEALNKYIQHYKLKLDKEAKKIVKSADPALWEEDIKLFKEKKAIREAYLEEHWDKVQEKRKVDREKRIEAKRIAEEKKYAEDIEKWRNGEGYAMAWRYKTPHSLLRYNESENRVETSKSVQVPVEAAKRLYNRINKVIAAGGCIETCPDKILNYQVREITKERLVVGCHNIPMVEVQRIAQQLQWV